MSWLKSIDRVFVINLHKREDRLLEITEQLEQYGIPFQRVSAIEKLNGAEGLRDTMDFIFKMSLDCNLQNILVFEDDAKFILGVEEFHLVMNKVFEQLPPNYLMCFLGGQPSAGYSSRYSPNLLPAIKYFSTHAVIYSNQGMKEIVTKDFGYPIDNWYVDVVQPIGHCYAVDPILATQRAGFSDIGKNYIDWNLFIEPKHNQEVSKMNHR